MHWNKKVILDISRRCPHRCIYCYFHHFALSDNSMMTMDTFTQLLPILRKEVAYVYLYNSGEPFLNRNIYQFIGMLNMPCEVATKMAVPIDFDRLKKAITGNVRFLVTKDADTQDVADKIANVNIELQNSNIEKLLSITKNVSIIKVENKYNRHEPGAKKEMGVFRHSLYKAGGIDIESFAVKNSRKPACRFTDTPLITSDGRIAICCHDFTYETASASVIEHSSIELAMQSKGYMSAIKNKGKYQVCEDCC